MILEKNLLRERMCMILLCKDKEEHLYPGCTNFTCLSAILKLYNLEAKNGWSDKSFTELLGLLKEMLSEGNTMQNRH